MSPEHPYDVFVSYRHQEPDKTWVRTEFVPALEAAGLRVCVDHRDVRLGAPMVTEMARAVEESRTRGEVLTPAYLEGRFADLDNVLAEHLGLEERAIRLIYVTREPCEPPLRIRARLRLDLRTEDEVAENLPRLIDALLRRTRVRGGLRDIDHGFLPGGWCVGMWYPG